MALDKKHNQDLGAERTGHNCHGLSRGDGDNRSGLVSLISKKFTLAEEILMVTILLAVLIIFMVPEGSIPFFKYK